MPLISVARAHAPALVRCSAAVEKTPLHVRSIAEIFALRPNARVVLLSRNGLDVASSFVERGFKFG